MSRPRFGFSVPWQRKQLRLRIGRTWEAKLSRARTSGPAAAPPGSQRQVKASAMEVVAREVDPFIREDVPGIQAMAYLSRGQALLDSAAAGPSERAVRERGPSSGRPEGHEPPWGGLAPAGPA